MSEAKLINYSTADFGAKADMELRLFKWQEQKEEYLPMLEAGGMLRFTTMRVWNKEGVFRLGYLFEYKAFTEKKLLRKHHYSKILVTHSYFFLMYSFNIKSV